MGDINIKLTSVRAKTGNIRKNIQSDILNGNKSKVKKLKKLMKESRGEMVTALKYQLDKEEQMVNSIGDILVSILEHIDTACTDFEQLDRSYASGKVQE